MIIIQLSNANDIQSDIFEIKNNKNPAPLTSESQCFLLCQLFFEESEVNVENKPDLFCFLVTQITLLIFRSVNSTVGGAFICLGGEQDELCECVICQEISSK